MRSGIVVSRDHVLLAIKAPADLITATVVPDLLEALTRLDVGELLPFLILAEISEKAGDGVSTLLFTGDLLLEVLVDVLLDLLLLLRCHFSTY